MARRPLTEEIAAVRTICRTLGLGHVTPALLKAAHHTTLLIPSLQMVARVQSAEPIGAARQRAGRELAVVRHLAAEGAPVIGPSGDRIAGPHVAGGMVATLWPHVAHAGHPDEADASLTAAALDAVHRGLQSYDGALPSYTETLDRCWQVLSDERKCASLLEGDRVLLTRQYRRLREAVEAHAHERVPLHGDAHLGNVLLGHDGPVWTDFENACLGPCALDIAGLPPTAWPHFHDADPMLIRLCADLRSICVAVWCWAEVDRSYEVREAAEYHLGRVREWE